ncbi:tRNA (adenosine(37)-N6)-dimethylallyltransferase MiaA [Candidatus Kaiserbacteria bacterium]|nr:tRNA (adenosine(37)-N6)-dimethylallyltransferase MiaA [Candidatus Kaiserbacteria bacterium]
MRKYQKVLVIVGPTSSGKSALAVELAKKFNGEVLSADSRQVYRGLDIGTGKITKKEMQGVRHHLLDVVSPKKVFTAHNFVERGRKAIDEIIARSKLPIIAGGTGFYIDALLGRVSLPDVAVNPRQRARLEKQTTAQLFALLKKKDPRRARTIDPHNKRRLIRALEIVAATGKVPINDLRGRYSAMWIGLMLPKRQLAKKIADRLRARLKQGLVAEARRLNRAGLSYKRMEQLGLEYRVLARHLRGEITRLEMIEQIDRGIRRYAKRQLTYWRRNRKVRWFSPDQQSAIERLASKHCKSM